MKHFALGELGLTPRLFYSLSVNEYFWMARGYWLRQEREWERARLIISALTGKSPIDIIRLSSDPEPMDWSDRTEEVEAAKHFVINAKKLWA